MLPYIIIKASSSSGAAPCILPKGIAVPVAPGPGYIGSSVTSFCAPDSSPPAKKKPVTMRGSVASISSGLGFNNNL